MESFVWNSIFETDVSVVDTQHHKLVDLINQFGDLLSHNQVETEDIKVLLKELVEYAEYHFKDEEALMRKLQIDQRHLEPHVISHDGFLEEVGIMFSGIDNENAASARHLLEFLTHWLAYHILGVDKNMARQIKAIESGVSPAEAFETEERAKDKSTEPLLVALNGLFKQVSTRNKELVQLNQSLEEKVRLRTHELSETNRHLEELSLTDVLSGLPNRRHAMRSLSNLWQESVDHKLPLVCMMVDADHFKEVNDNYGHDAGDEVLVQLSRLLRHSFRTDDVVCRIGGDEFFVICPNTDLQGGLYIAELTRSKVAEMRVETGGEPWHGSISMGVAARTADMDSHESLLKKADEAAYAAKRAGKNCVKSAD